MPIRKTPWDKFGEPPQATIRLICNTNKQLNKRYNLSLPYSVTILPSFISPYSRHTVKQVTTAIANYANDRTKNIVEAAYDMGAENEKTFLRYYKRFKERYETWRTVITSKLAKLNISSLWKRQPVFMQITPQPIKRKWENFCLLVDEYCSEISKIKNSSNIVLFGLFNIQYVLAIIGETNKGLGP